MKATRPFVGHLMYSVTVFAAGSASYDNGLRERHIPDNSYPPTCYTSRHTVTLIR